MSFKTVLPAGKYWIGDPCYPFPNYGPKSDLWDKFLEKTYNEQTNYCDLREIQIWAGSTCYGDGLYFGGGYKFPVDSGLLGIIPISTVQFLNRTDVVLSDLGAFVEFTDPFAIEITEDGAFTFGHIVIETS